MGYGQRASGKIQITPPITAAELRAHPEFDDDRRTAVLVIQREFTPTELGEICVFSASEAAVSNPDESFSRYGLVAQMQQMVDVFRGHAWRGHIILTGEDGDQTALVVDDNRTVKEIEPKIVWPWSDKS